MDKNQNPGINIDVIRLVNAHIELLDWTQSKLSYELRVIDWQRTLSSDGTHLTTVASFDIMAEVAQPAFKFTCAFIARYSREETANMSWLEFTDPMALAHIMPFVREFVNNMTSRLPVPPLMLPAMNTGFLLSEYQARKPALPAPAP